MNDVVVGYWWENGCFAVVVEVSENEVEDVAVTLCGVLYSLDQAKFGGGLFEVSSG